MTRFCLRWPVSLAVGCAVGLVCFSYAPARAQPSHSPSYQYGYNMMMGETRGIVSDVASQGVHESMAQVVGSSEQIPVQCEGWLESAIVGSTKGTVPPLPDNFSSTEFLSGCTDAGKSILESGR